MKNLTEFIYESQINEGFFDWFKNLFSKGTEWVSTWKDRFGKLSIKNIDPKNLRQPTETITKIAPEVKKAYMNPDSGFPQMTALLKSGNTDYINQTEYKTYIFVPDNPFPSEEYFIATIGWPKSLKDVGKNLALTVFEISEYVQDPKDTTYEILKAFGKWMKDGKAKSRFGNVETISVDISENLSKFASTYKKYGFSSADGNTYTIKIKK